MDHFMDHAEKNWLERAGEHSWVDSRWPTRVLQAILLLALLVLWLAGPDVVFFPGS